MCLKAIKSTRKSQCVSRNSFCLHLKEHDNRTQLEVGIRFTDLQAIPFCKFLIRFCLSPFCPSKKFLSSCLPAAVFQIHCRVVLRIQSCLWFVIPDSIRESLNGLFSAASLPLDICHCCQDIRFVGGEWLRRFVGASQGDVMKGWLLHKAAAAGRLSFLSLFPSSTRVALPLQVHVSCTQTSITNTTCVIFWIIAFVTMGMRFLIYTLVSCKNESTAMTPASQTNIPQNGDW